MKRALNYIVHNRKEIFKTLAIIGGAIVAFVIAHYIGTLERGYEALGGELLVPMVIVFVAYFWDEIKDTFCDEEN
jgi:fucose permease